MRYAPPMPRARVRMRPAVESWDIFIALSMARRLPPARISAMLGMPEAEVEGRLAEIPEAVLRGAEALVDEHPAGIPDEMIAKLAEFLRAVRAEGNLSPTR